MLVGPSRRLTIYEPLVSLKPVVGLSTRKQSFAYLKLFPLVSRRSLAVREIVDLRHFSANY